MPRSRRDREQVAGVQGHAQRDRSPRYAEVIVSAAPRRGCQDPPQTAPLAHAKRRRHRAELVAGHPSESSRPWTGWIRLGNGPRRNLSKAPVTPILPAYERTGFRSDAGG